MKMKNMKKLLAVALVIMSVVAIAAPALAQTGLPVNSTAYTIKGDVAVRSSAGVSSSNIITRLGTGSAVNYSCNYKLRYGLV